MSEPGSLKEQFWDPIAGFGVTFRTMFKKVVTEEYPEDADFPGRDQLGLRAEAACASASEDIDPDVVTVDLQVTLLRATPTAETWADGDRRVDCFAVVEDGDTIAQSLLTP